jgi:hypothetical protein
LLDAKYMVLRIAFIKSVLISFKLPKMSIDTIGEGRDKIAEVSKKWFRVADNYGVQIEPGQNDVLILAVTVALDSMAHEGH